MLSRPRQDTSRKLGLPGGLRGNSSGCGSDPTRKNIKPGASAPPAVLHGERLHQIVVFELREDGSTEYCNMTLRALYNYVVGTITDACRQANMERQSSRRHVQIMEHNISPPSDKDARGDALDSTIDATTTKEEEAAECGNGHPTTPSSPYRPPITPHSKSNTIPPHLPSLTSSDATPPGSANSNSLPTPILSNRSADALDGRPLQPKLQHHHHQPQHNPRQRATQTAFTPLPNNGNTHRERLGGYLHPRDMRRLVTPFSSSNEPQLMVRRHVMLLNFDPLRAVVLRDRLLVLVPDGADSILIELERRVRGGITEMENQVFGTTVHESSSTGAMELDRSLEQFTKVEIQDSRIHPNTTCGNNKRQSVDPTETENPNDEYEDIQKMDWVLMPYELQALDSVLLTVTTTLTDDAHRVHHRAHRSMRELLGDYTRRSTAGLGENAQERLRLHKDEVKLMEGRVQGFVRAMNEALDDDEDMTLMNLSRLLTHPDRFLQPVSQEVLHEESDEPELILEAYLQQALSIVNELDLLKGQIMTTEEQINMTLDAIRNRLLYINTLLSLASLCVATGSFVGSIFGMNLRNHMEQDKRAFARVTSGVIAGMILMWAILSWIFYRVANTYSDWRKKTI